MSGSVLDPVMHNGGGSLPKISFNYSTDEVEVLELASSFDSEKSTQASDDASTDFSDVAFKEEEREFFRKARTCLSPGAMFRYIVQFYAERKIVIFFWIHLVGTLIIWLHFALIKWEEQKETVPEDAPRYWWKRIAPPLEFGSMHAILFQMALLPITMSRYSIASLSESIVNKIVPLNRTLQMHVHLGYTMVAIVFLATIFFFAFFGLLCAEGDETFCAKFTSEIMLTGYAILGTLLIIGGTSYFRHKIPYELFYGIHHLVFIMFFITIAHTLDVEQRTGRKTRSQTFMWFSSTLAFYLCDRAAMYINHWYDSKLQGSSVVTGHNNGSKTILLRVQRPTLLTFRPGQYVFLRICKIDNQWHPFSIASCPNSSELEFYIEVYEAKSWTATLCNFLVSNKGSSLRVEVMGPYGTSIAKSGNYSHVLAVGAGTGIVPVLSVFKATIRDLLQLDPHQFFSEMKSREKKVRMMEIAEEQHKGSLMSKAASGCKRENECRPKTSRTDRLSAAIRRSVDRHDQLIDGTEVKNNLKMMKKAASDATKSIWGVFLLSSLPPVGITLFGLTVSWNTIPIELHPNMVDILKIFTIVFQSLFGAVALFFWDLKGILAFVDVALIGASPFADYHYFRICDEFGRLRPIDIFTYSLLILYMTGRLWERTVAPRHSTWQKVSELGSTSKVEKFTLVWTTRCASQVSALLPSISVQWDTLVSTWGLGNATEVCSISIHVTDTDENACRKLRREIRSTSLYSTGAIKFGRADLERDIEDHSINLVCTRSSSHSLLAFCGSPSLAVELHKYKISNDMILAITGNKKHQMDFIGESYGGPKSRESNVVPSDGSSDMESEEPLTTRKSMRYNLRKKNSLRNLMDFVKGHEGQKSHAKHITSQNDMSHTHK